MCNIKGISLFTQEYGASNFEELDWSTYYAYITRGTGGNTTLSETEKLILEEKLQIHEESSRTKHVGGVSLAFELSKETLAAISAFTSEPPTSNWIEVKLHRDTSKEVLVLAKSLLLTTFDGFQKLLPEEDNSARFIVTRIPDGSTGELTTVFAFYCPDDAPPKQKMTMSTVKSAFRAELEGKGIDVKIALDNLISLSFCYILKI